MLQQDTEGTERRTLHKYVDFTGRRVLEIGCGDGRLTWKYAADARSVTALDLEFDDLRVATADRPADLQAVALLQADSTHLPFQKEKFDIALLAWSL